MTELHLTMPDDWHLHLRDGALLAETVPATARAFARAIVMPNLVPPVLDAEAAMAYRQRIEAARPAENHFAPLMTLYLTDHTTAEMIHAAHAAGVVAVKLYPAGATTHSDLAVTSLDRLEPVFEALTELGRHEEAQDLARRGSAMGCLHHAIEPGRAGSAYRQMRQADRNMESEVSKLISALPETEDTGACICDFETFKEIYRVQRGVQVRYGLQVFLAILTMAPSQNTDAAETALMVEQLGDLIRTNLRQCDVAARYTDMQYVVMLSGSTAESGTGPLERIKAAFYRIPAHGRYLLSYSLYVPEAKADSGRVRRRKKTAKKEK